MASGDEPGIQHPYWDLYQRLLRLRDSQVKQVIKQELLAIAKELNFSLANRLKLETLLLLPWFKPAMVYEFCFARMREKFSYSVLSPEMLGIIRQYSPLVEIGAGNGYNTWLLRQMGASVEAIEAYPVEEGKNWFFDTGACGLPTRNGTSWTQVTKGDTSDLEKFTDHTLLIIWPPINSMGSDALKHYHGSHIILIANKKNCANQHFYKSLNTDWHLVHSTQTNHWGNFQVEWFEVYSRKAMPETPIALKAQSAAESNPSSV